MLCRSPAAKVAASAGISLPLNGTALHPGREGHSPAGVTALLSAERALRAEVGTSDTKGYW